MKQPYRESLGFFKKDGHMAFGNDLLKLKFCGFVRAAISCRDML